MFIKITRRNQNGEEKENLIDTSKINAIVEKTQEQQNLYDEDGNLVKTEKPTERLFVVLLAGGVNLTINEDTYNELVKKLTK